MTGVLSVNPAHRSTIWPPRGSARTPSPSERLLTAWDCSNNSHRNPSLAGVLSEIAFHEKAGRGQVKLFPFLFDKVFFSAE